MWTGGPAPLGYRIVKTPGGHSTLEVDPEAVEFLELVIGLVVDEGMTPYQAAKRINALGYRTSRGTTWSHRNLRHHLERRHLIGEIPYDTPTGPIPRQFPPIITQERYTELQAALQRNARAAPRKVHSYPFSGRIDCECGGHLVGAWRKDRGARYYLCSSNTNSALTDRRCHLSPRQIRASTLEGLLWEPIQEALADPQRLLDAATLASQGGGEDLDQLHQTARDLERKLATLEEERLRTFRDARSLGLTNHEVKTLLERLGAERDELTAALRRIQRQVELAERREDPLEQARTLATQAASRLQDPDLDTQAQLVELLDIRVKRHTDGYEITGAIPIDSPSEAGYIATKDPRDS